MAFRDVDTIKEHLIIGGFILGYIVWIHHGETMVVDDSNIIDREEDATTLRYPRMKK
jgi:hypothetical protein